MRSKIALLIFLISIIFYSTSFVFAEGSGSIEISLNATKDSYTPSENIVVKVSLENMQGEFCKDGISSIGTYYIDFDDKALKVKSIEKLVNPTYLYVDENYEPNSIQFKYVDISDEQSNFLSNNTDLFKITFEVLTEAEYGKTFVQIDTTTGTIGDANAHLKNVTEKDLEVTIADDKTSSATLTNLFVDDYSITPSFDKDTKSYTLVVNYRTDSIKLNLEASENAVISITSDKDSEIIDNIVNLSVGTNKVTITVKDTETNNDNIYTLTVNRNRASSTGGSYGGTITPSTNNRVQNNTITINASKDSNNHISADVDSNKMRQAIDNARQEATQNGEDLKVNIIISSIGVVSGTKATINKASFKLLEYNHVSALTVENPVANLTFDESAIKKISINSSSDVTISIDRANNNILDDTVKATIKSAPVYDFNVKSGDKTISDFGSGYITVTIPYELKVDDNKDSLSAYYINGDTLEKISDVIYDSENKMVSFKTQKLSKFAIVVEKTKVQSMFIDIQNYPWAKEAIEELAKDGIIRGTSKDTYSPGNNITRADFMLLLVRLFNISGTLTDNFEDVKTDKYYYNDIGLAKEMGLTTGVGNNKFEPESNITRQDMFVLAYRILKSKNLVSEKKVDLSSYSDSQNISNYAQDSIENLIAAKLVQGDKGRINPFSNATRAETAVFIYRLNKLIK